MQTRSVLTVGSVAFDSITTPTGKADSVLGGSVNYFSVSCAFFNPVQVIGVVGDDFPKSHLDALTKRGIDVSGIEVTSGKTFHWVGSYEGKMNEANTLSTFLNVFEHFNPKLKPHHQDAKSVFLANIDPTLQTSVLDQVKAVDFVAADSMNFWITGKLDELKKTLKRVDMLTINEGEAALLSGEKTLAKAVAKIQTMGPSIVVIKRGEYGSMLFSPNGVFIAPAYPLENVVDPTGAGDTFAGGLMGRLTSQGFSKELLKNEPMIAERMLRHAVITGSVMASFTCEDFSLNRLMKLEKNEIEKRERELMKMISLDLNT